MYKSFFYHTEWNMITFCKISEVNRVCNGVLIQQVCRKPQGIFRSIYDFPLLSCIFFSVYIHFTEWCKKEFLVNLNVNYTFIVIRTQVKVLDFEDSVLSTILECEYKIFRWLYLHHQNARVFESLWLELTVMIPQMQLT